MYLHKIHTCEYLPSFERKSWNTITRCFLSKLRKHLVSEKLRNEPRCIRKSELWTTAFATVIAGKWNIRVTKLQCETEKTMHNVHNMGQLHIHLPAACKTVIFVCVPEPRPRMLWGHLKYEAATKYTVLEHSTERTSVGSPWRWAENGISKWQSCSAKPKKTIIHNYILEKLRAVASGTEVWIRSFAVRQTQNSTSQRKKYAVRVSKQRTSADSFRGDGSGKWGKWSRGNLTSEFGVKQILRNAQTPKVCEYKMWSLCWSLVR